MNKQTETEEQIYKRVSRRAWIVGEFKPLLKGSDNEQLNELYKLIIDEAEKRGLKEHNQWTIK